MADARVLAFLTSAETADRVPADAQFVPLRPNLGLPGPRVLVDRPEALLGNAESAEVDRTTERILEGLKARLHTEALRWRGVDMIDCFLGDAELGLRDAMKAAQVIDKALERSNPASVVTDAPPFAGGFPTYPYLSALEPLLRERARREGIAFRSLAPPAAPGAKAVPSLLAKAYLSVAARRGLRHLQEGHPITALGPYPEFFLPVARAASTTAATPLVVVTRAAQPMRADRGSGLSVLALESFLEGADRTVIEAFRAAAQPPLAEAAESEADRAHAPYIGGILGMHLCARFDQEAPALALLGLAFERGLERAIAALALETESPLGRAFVRYARARRVPVTVLQHGVLAGAFSYGRTDADRIAAWGATDAAWFRSHASPPVRAEATGCPRYDDLGASHRTPNVRDLEGIPPGKRLVLYASQPFVQDRAARSPWERADALRMALDAAAEMGNILLAVKWHPAETPEPLPEDAALYARSVRADAVDLVRASRVVLAMSSTVAFEAMLLDRPVVFLGPADPKSPFHPPEDGAGRRATQRAELLRHLAELVPDGASRREVLEGQRRFLSQHYTPLDGSAAGRVLRLVTEG